MMKKDCTLVVEVVDMLNENKNNFSIVSDPRRRGGGSKPYIMVRKGAIVTYIWSFRENFENYRKLVLPQEGTCHVCIRGCACHVFGSEISLEISDPYFWV